MDFAANFYSKFDYIYVRVTNSLKLLKIAKIANFNTKSCVTVYVTVFYSKSDFSHFMRGGLR